jgi:hypothetical protein
MMKTAFSQQQSGHASISSGTGEEQLSGSYLSFDTFLEILELLRRAHIRQVGKEDECFEAFEALNYRFRTATPSMHRTGSLMTDENSSTAAGGSGTVKGSRVSIPLKQVEEIVKAVGVEYDFHSLLAAVDSNFDGNVTPTQFRWCAGTEDPTIVAAFVALGGEETLSGTIPVDVLISRCAAMGMTAQYIANFVTEIDVNNDGVVDFSEFLAMIVRHKESKELKRTWSTGAKVFQPGGSQRIDSLATELLPGTGSGASGQPIITATAANGVGVGVEGFNSFPRRNNFRRMSHQDGPNSHRPSFPLQPDLTNSNPSPHSTPLNPYGFQNHPPIQTFGLNEGINLDEETNVSEDFEPGSGNEFGRSSEDGEGSESNSSDSDAAFVDSHDGTFSILAATTADRGVAAKHPKSSKKRKTAGGGFSIDIQGLIHRKAKSKADEKSWTDRIAEVTAKGRNNIAAHRQKVAKYMTTTAVLPVKKIATERDGLVDVSTEKGRNQIKYYFGVKKRLPSKNLKVNPRLTAPPRRYVDELLEEAKRTQEAQEAKAKAKQQVHSAPRTAAAASLAAAAAVFLAYTGFCNKATEEAWDSLPPDVLLEQMLLGGNRFSRKPSTANPRRSRRETSPSVTFSAASPSSRPASARRSHTKPVTDSTAVVAPRKPISKDISHSTQHSPPATSGYQRRSLYNEKDAGFGRTAPPQNRIQRRLSEQLDLRAVLEEATESWNDNPTPPKPRPPAAGPPSARLKAGSARRTQQATKTHSKNEESSNQTNSLRHIFLNNPGLEQPSYHVVDMSAGI